MSEHKNEPSGKEADQMLATMLTECPELGDVVEQFVRSLPARVDVMKEALREGSLSQISAQAQQIKCTGKAHGLKAISKQAAEIERAAHDGLIDQLSGKIAEVYVLIRKIKRELEKNNQPE